MKDAVQVSIDWCSETLKRVLPWDDSQYVTVRRFSGREKRQRQALAGTFKVGADNTEEMEIQMTYDKLKDFEWVTAIVDFRLKDGMGKVHIFKESKPEANKKIYDHLTGPLEKFVDELILEVNKESKTEIPSEEAEEVSEN